MNDYIFARLLPESQTLLLQLYRTPADFAKCEEYDTERSILRDACLAFDAAADEPAAAQYVLSLLANIDDEYNDVLVGRDPYFGAFYGLREAIRRYNDNLPT